MDKPENMGLKEWLIRKIAAEEEVAIEVVEEIVRHQFNSAYENLQTCDSLEFSGFGKLFYNRKKAEKKMKKFHEQRELFSAMLKKEDLPEAKRRNAEFKLAAAERNIEYLSVKVKPI